MNMVAVLRSIYQGVDIKARHLDNGAGFLLKSDIHATIQFNSNKAMYPQVEELSKAIDAYNSREVPVIFIEKFCAGILGEVLLEKIPLNVAEAFVLSLVLLGVSSTSELNFKLGISGLLKPALIKGIRVHETEKLADFVFDSLENADLIQSYAIQRKTLPGKGLNVERIFG
jgi:hypothetical protein